ncbi:CUB and sushi domain-containing protein 3 [Liparis tanakae]|uniref:CUB and sushi domain-containing protein 3 n=1 Tax=Liparis tanakae TaxID=230148 RepID=A0A4Z2EAF6_9TELE|nr:CUB and sushi domain-containing protein 3 [Liparis tanakae]
MLRLNEKSFYILSEWRSAPPGGRAWPAARGRCCSEPLRLVVVSSAEGKALWSEAAGASEREAAGQFNTTTPPPSVNCRPNIYSQSLASLSGDLETPFSLTTAGHQLLLRWSSDHGTNRRGFHLRYVGEYQSMYPAHTTSTLSLDVPLDVCIYIYICIYSYIYLYLYLYLYL